MRKTDVKRTTKETSISCTINLDGTGQSSVNTGVGFFDHMLEIFSHHSLIDLRLEAVGDSHVDFHHTIEDSGYVIAEAITKALSDKRGIRRYGFFYVPMDECLSRCVIDFSGRPELVWNVDFSIKKIGEMDTELFEEFFKAFTNESKCNLHIENIYGKNNHHIIESCFKAFARSIRDGVKINKRVADQIPSSKGIL